ncbi:MAG: hypothetical protein JRN08_09190 [Nitrososphaerota archaeon]|nr:hypothetical protein [Nitrososphaerota archaeon]
MGKQLVVRLTEADEGRLEKIKESLGVEADSEAIRYALKKGEEASSK